MELRLAAAASPRRVADAAAMMAAALEAAFPAVEGLTLVVENFDMKVRLRAWGKESRLAADALKEFIKNPTASVPMVDVSGLADLLRSYCRDNLEDGITFWRPGARKPFRIVDREFIKILDVINEERMLLEGSTATTKLRGTTVVSTPVYRVGRSSEDADPKARIRIDGKYVEVKIAASAFAEFCEAAKHARPVSVRLTASWVRKDEGLVLIANGTTATAVERRDTERVNARLVAIGPVVTDDEAALIWAGLGRGDDE